MTSTQLALEDAIQNDDLDGVRTAIDAGADAGGMCHGLDQAIVSFACQMGNLDILLTLADYGADLDLANARGMTLVAASARGSDENPALTAILAAGADPDLSDRDGYTPIHWSSVLGYEANTRALLRFGADATRENNAGMLPSDLAKTNGHDGVSTLLKLESQREPVDLSGLNRRASRLGLSSKLIAPADLQIAFGNSTVVITGNPTNLAFGFTDGSSWHGHFPFVAIVDEDRVLDYSLHAFVRGLANGDFVELTLTSPGSTERYLDHHAADLSDPYLEPAEELSVRRLTASKSAPPRA